jgi:hypothetical protein
MVKGLLIVLYLTIVKCYLPVSSPAGMRTILAKKLLRPAVESLLVDQPGDESKQIVVKDFPDQISNPTENQNIVIHELPSTKKLVFDSLNQYESEMIDIYRLSLTSDTPTSRVVIVQKDNITDDRYLLINTFMTFRDSKGYPFTLKRTADQVFFLPEAFKELMQFFFSESKSLNLTSGDTNYKVVKHFEIPDFYHVTIWMTTPSEMAENPQNINRGVWLSLPEYKYLLSRSSQLLKDLKL